VTVGEPSWDEVCDESGQGGVALPAYEVFPITILATPNLALVLQTGRASVSSQQVAEGASNGSVWTGFDPAQVTTDSSGVARSNLTIAGAVMPFVPNPLASVSLPITATSSNGVEVTAGLPIEFLGDEGGLANLHVLLSPGPLLFSGTLQVSAGNSLAYEYLIAYAPSGLASAPVNVSLSVVGSLEGGTAGPLPAGVQVSFQESAFQMRPGGVVVFWVDESNSIVSADLTGVDSYTFAVRENVGGETFLEPLSVVIGPAILVGPLGLTGNPAVSKGTFLGLGSGEVLALIAVVATVAVLGGLLLLRRRRAPLAGPGQPDPAAQQRVDLL
jgi:hypothetical protein